MIKKILCNLEREEGSMSNVWNTIFKYVDKTYMHNLKCFMVECQLMETVQDRDMRKEMHDADLIEKNP